MFGLLIFGFPVEGARNKAWAPAKAGLQKERERERVPRMKRPLSQNPKKDEAM